MPSRARELLNKFKNRDVIPDIPTIAIQLDDAIIMRDDNIFLGLEVDGKQVRIQFPVYNQFDNYTNDLGKLFIQLSLYIDDLQMDNLDDIDKTIFPVWASIVGHVIQHKKIRKLIDRIFFRYLCPRVDGVLLKRRYIKKHITIDKLFIMFVSILQVEDWLKKKSRSILEKTFQKVTSHQSINPSMNTTELASEKQDESLFYKFD